jgi:hypothetical protein
MLFDLRGKGRRRVIKVVYVMLAILLGGGLVLFGIGGETSGGLVDAITGTPSNTGDDDAKKEAAAASKRVKANPNDAAAWSELTRARVKVAQSGDLYDSNTGVYTDAGKEKLRLAVSSWERYLALETENTDDKASLASRMVRVFASLNDLTAAARAQEIIAESRDSLGAYSRLAELSYAAGQMRKGDLAAEKAIAKADPDKREGLRGSFESMKQQGVQNQVTPPAPE